MNPRDVTQIEADGEWDELEELFRINELTAKSEAVMRRIREREEAHEKLTKPRRKGKP